MAKYSTGGGGGGGEGSCELCGREDVDLRTANVAGATLQVCSNCARHGDSGPDSGSGSDRDERERKRRTARNVARLDDARKGDPSHWEEGADYDDDQLPYLVSDYGSRLTEARQAAGLQIDELAEELGVDESDVLALEQGRATQAGVGGSVVAALEDHLDVQLEDET